MTTGTNFIRGSNPVWYFVDLVGKQTDGSFYLWTLTNTIPYIPQAVYHDINGLIPWTDPIEFLANGTLPIDIFFDDTKVYRLEIRQNNGLAPPSQADALVYFVENYIPNGTGGGNAPITTSSAIENQLANSQFSAVNFQQPVTFTNGPQSIEIAPGWFLDLNGVGSVEVSQIPLNDTLSNPTNAPYALKFHISGPWTNSPILRQRFQQNGMNWAGQTIASSLTGRADSPVQTLTARLVDSTGTPLALLQTVTLTTAFDQYKGNAPLSASTNPNLPPNAWIDYQLLLPTFGDVYLTSLQVVVSSPNTNVAYQQDTIDRQLDHLAHYYKPQLEYKPIPSYLVGWDFAKNPAQLLGDTVPSGAGYGANKSFYVWDQTIVFQSANDGVGVQRAANGGGIQLVASINTQMAIVQYLEMAQVRDLLQGDISVYLAGLTTGAGGYNGTISLWVNNTDANLPVVATGTNNSIVLTLDANGYPTTRNGTWTEIPRSNFGNAQFELAPPLSELVFGGWNLNGAAISNNAIWFAIVVGFATVTSGDSITIQSVGLNAGKMATRPAPKTLSETLLDCQRYYWKTFANSTKPATAVAPGALKWQAILNAPMADNVLSVEMPTPVRGAAPIITMYNPVVANNTIRNITANLDCISSATMDASNKNILLSGDLNGAGAAGNILSVNLTADARLGIVN